MITGFAYLQVPDVDIVIGCGDNPCARLPRPGRGAATTGRRQDRRRLAAAAAEWPGGAQPVDGSASNVSGGSSGGGCAKHPRVDAVGTLLPSCRHISGRASSSGGASNSSHPWVAGSGSGNGGISSASRGTDLRFSGDSRHPRALQGTDAEPNPVLPMFMYDTRETYADIPFPDFSYWGHEVDRLWGATQILPHQILPYTTSSQRARASTWWDGMRSSSFCRGLHVFIAFLMCQQSCMCSWYAT